MTSPLCRCFVTGAIDRAAAGQNFHAHRAFAHADLVLPAADVVVAGDDHVFDVTGAVAGKSGVHPHRLHGDAAAFGHADRVVADHRVGRAVVNLQPVVHDEVEIVRFDPHPVQAVDDVRGLEPVAF